MNIIQNTLNNDILCIAESYKKSDKFILKNKKKSLNIILSTYKSYIIKKKIKFINFVEDWKLYKKTLNSINIILATYKSYITRKNVKTMFLREKEKIYKTDIINNQLEYINSINDLYLQNIL